MKGLGNLSLRSVEGPERANRRIYGSENGCRVLNWYVKGVPFGISILNIKTCE